jgi:hypothetical protein
MAVDRSIGVAWPTGGGGVVEEVERVARFAWGDVFAELVANALWFAVTASLSALFLWKRDRARLSGRWRASIRWKPDWSEQRLLGTASLDPHSEGVIALSYGSGVRRNQYWGLSVWRLHDGDQIRAEVCVELRSIELRRRWSRRPPFVRHDLVSARLDSRIRREIGRFRYPAAFASYYVQFNSSTEDRLAGAVQAIDSESGDMLDVGTFDAERLA